MSELDYNKVIGYARMFNEWKQELFPKEEYAYKNGCCFAFAHLLAEKARGEGMLPLKVWCLPQSGKNLKLSSPPKTVSERANVSGKAIMWLWR